MVDSPIIVPTNSCPINLACVLEAVKAGTLLSVDVHVTEHKPILKGLKFGVLDVVLLNSLVLVEPSGLTQDQL